MTYKKKDPFYKIIIIQRMRIRISVTRKISNTEI